MNEPTGSGARSALELVWSLHGQDDEPSGTRPGLTVGRIVAAAIEVADAAGLAAVSMSRVAGSLGFTTMSLYRHVRSKEELILLMQDTAVGRPPGELDAQQGGWRVGLERWAWAVLTAMRPHPWLLQTIPMFGPPATPYQLAWLDRGLRTLHGTGLSESEKMNTMLLVDAHVLSDLQFAAIGEQMLPEGGVDGYRETLARMLDPAQYPAVVRMLKGGALDSSGDAATDRDHDFTFGLARILDGVERLVERRT